MTACRHCGEVVPAGAGEFCCNGCAGAYQLVHHLGLGRWYEARRLQAGVRAPRPDAEGALDPTAYIRHASADRDELHLMVEGLHCAACVWLIESLLSRQPGVASARVNMTTRRLTLAWRPGAAEPAALLALVGRLGYRLVPYDPERLAAAASREDGELLRALAVAGFAAANVMLLSVAVWAGAFEGMGPATRDLLHWISALIALPAIAYAGMPFFRSAFAALRSRRLNMDVPISLGVLLAAAVSLLETAQSGEYAYFDAAVTLLFFLLIGRYLDRRARARARSAAEQLIGLKAVAATIIAGDGSRRSIPAAQIRPGDRIAVAAGERIAIDGTVAQGRSSIDASLVTGESLPAAVRPGDKVYAGTINLTGALTLTASAAAADTLLAEIVRLMAVGEQCRARYVRLADRVAGHYAPVVHGLALATLLGWLAAGTAWQPALLVAVSVLIVTCPCALGLAVPAVQVVATGRLLRRGILVKAQDALERLAAIDTVVLDKTGTLTLGRPELLQPERIAKADLELAAGLASASRHPLARALARACPAVPALADVHEEPGCGLETVIKGNRVRLGSRSWCGVAANDSSDETDRPAFWLARQGRATVRFDFADALRPDAAASIAALRAQGLRVLLLSGDRPAAVQRAASEAGISDWRANQSPAEKVAALSALRDAGHQVLMIGDGLNDAPALAAGTVSISPSSAADISQTAADIIFQGDRLQPVLEAIAVARRAARLVRQNFALAIGYNLLAVPLAMAGLVTPLLAAVAMSASSIAVSLNSLRLGRSDARSTLPDSGGAAARPARPAGFPVGVEERAV